MTIIIETIFITILLILMGFGISRLIDKFSKNKSDLYEEEYWKSLEGRNYDGPMYRDYPKQK